MKCLVISIFRYVYVQCLMIAMFKYVNPKHDFNCIHSKSCHYHCQMTAFNFPAYFRKQFRHKPCYRSKYELARSEMMVGFDIWIEDCRNLPPATNRTDWRMNFQSRYKNILWESKTATPMFVSCLFCLISQIFVCY